MNSTEFEPHQSNLISDGSTFPPVTPDPPPPPGYVDPLEGTGVTEAAAPDGDDGESSSAH